MHPFDLGRNALARNKPCHLQKNILRAINDLQKLRQDSFHPFQPFFHQKARGFHRKDLMLSHFPPNEFPPPAFPIYGRLNFFRSKDSTCTNADTP
jgi:hypothetical protein